MQVGFVSQGRIVKCGDATGRLLRMSGSDALIELDTGKRVMWSGATEVEILDDVEEILVNHIPRLEAELARLLSYTEGKYAKLGIVATSLCTELPKKFHSLFIRAALGKRPKDAIVCRRCISKLCINTAHLFWGTKSDCQRDMVLRGVAKPSGKHVTPELIEKRITRLRARLSKLVNKC